MPLVNEIEPGKMITALADSLKNVEQINPPEWSKFAKTGVGKERPPQQDDWWFIRSAAILRKLYMGEKLGVSKTKKLYSTRKNRGHKPEHKRNGSGSVARKVFQQLEAAGFAKKEKTGREISPAGQKFVNSIAKTVK